jgi:hypothetical protein
MIPLDNASDLDAVVAMAKRADQVFVCFGNIA